jgi:hypothetical protein
MEVNIQDVVATVHAVDGEALLAPRTLEKIVQAVLLAVHEREEHGRRVKLENKVTPGSQDDGEGYGR